MKFCCKKHCPELEFSEDKQNITIKDDYKNEVHMRFDQLETLYIGAKAYLLEVKLDEENRI